MGDKVYISVTVGRPIRRPGRYDVLVEAVDEHGDQVVTPVRLYFEAEADGVNVYDNTGDTIKSVFAAD